MAEEYSIGDFFTVQRNTPVGWLIQLVTKSHQSHAGVICGEDGRILEAEWRGARFNYIHRYPNAKIHHVEMKDYQQQVFSAACQAAEGIPYGFLDIISIGLLQYGVKPAWLRNRVKKQSNAICSQLVDRLEWQAGVHLFNDGRIEQDVTPGDLDKLPMTIG